MAERDPIELLREQLNQLEGLLSLPPDHENFKRWYQETQKILEKIFGPKSVHCQSFFALRFREVSLKAFSSPEIEKINMARYKRDLEIARGILHGAIKELNLDRTLFKKIQTTPKTVEVSLKGEYFISSGIKDPELLKAIHSAFEGSGLKSLHGAEDIQNRMEQIRQARFGIYEISSSSVDSFLELGMALGMGREVLLIYPKGTPLPRSLQALPQVDYENLSELIGKLKRRAK